MKKFLFSFIVLLVAFSCSPVEETQEKQLIFKDGQRHIVLMHPTIANLERFIFLTGSGVFPLPEGYRAVGVYHQSAAYNYEQSRQFLLDQGRDDIVLLGLEPPLQIDGLFEKNPLSPRFREIFENSEGIIFFGGPDIPPSIYGEPTSLLTVITDPHRHYMELSFLFHLLGGYQDKGFEPLLDERPDFNILGICLGMQTMNVATGGTMYQDIPTELYDVHTVEEMLAMHPDRQHRNYYSHLRLDEHRLSDSYHRISLKPGSIMAQVAGNPELMPHVLSSHHQALKKIGKGWVVTAWCMDGLVAEAIEHNKYPNVIGIQFHPEIINLYTEESMRVIPGEATGYSFFQTYPGAEGEDFHKNFWRYMGNLYDQGLGLPE